MLRRKKYFQFVGFLTLLAFLLSNSNPLFYKSEVLEEEEQRFETEDSEADRFLADYNGNSGFNILPDFDPPAIVHEESEIIFEQPNFAVTVNVETTQSSQAQLPKLFILFHNLKLDFC